MNLDIKQELKEIINNLKIVNHKNLDKIFQVIIKSAIFEFLYRPKTSVNVIIKECRMFTLQ